MTEEKRQPHPQEPAEGAPDDVEAPGFETADGESNEEPTEEKRAEQHPQEPAEG